MVGASSSEGFVLELRFGVVGRDVAILPMMASLSVAVASALASISSLHASLQPTASRCHGYHHHHHHHH